MTSDAYSAERPKRLCPGAEIDAISGERWQSAPRCCPETGIRAEREAMQLESQLGSPCPERISSAPRKALRNASSYDTPSTLQA